MPEYFDKLSTPSKRPLKVFLCHASADKHTAFESNYLNTESARS